VLRALALNAGSSSLKASLYDVKPGAALAAPPRPRWQAQVDWRPRDADGAVSRLLDGLWHGPASVLDGPVDVDVVGHRVVHGGEHYREPTLLSAGVKERIASLSVSAPLHNAAALRGIDAVERLVGPGTPQVAVFDTAFHASLPPAAYTYPGPHEWVGAGLRRFGFHGINHEYVAYRAAHLLDRPVGRLRLITCHLGSGCSLAAVRGGRSVDTTMGFTPLEGVMMATRSGSVDPGLLLHLLRQPGASVDELDSILNHRAGLAGLAGGTGDLRDVLSARADGDQLARVAFDVYIHRLRQALGGMLAGLGGLDAVVFTGGVGERSAEVRAAALEPFMFLGVDLDRRRNAASPLDADVAAKESKVRVLVVAAREDWAIARTAASLADRSPSYARAS
jgi:acetate kinase